MADEKLRRGAKTKTEVLLSDIWNKLSTLGGGGGGGLATEVTLQSVLSAIQDGQDFEAKIVVDNNGNGTTYLEVRIWNPDTQTWEAPLYYLPGSNVGVPAGSLTPAIVYVNPAALQAQILAAIQAQGTVPQATEATLSTIEAWQSSINTILSIIETETANLDVALSTRASEATLLLLEAKLNSLGQKASAASAPVVLSTEQEAILATIDSVLDAIKLDTANISSDPATQTTLAALLTELQLKADLSETQPVSLPKYWNYRCYCIGYSIRTRTKYSV
jgi:hypothetical protein